MEGTSNQLLKRLSLIFIGALTISRMTPGMHDKIVIPNYKSPSGEKQVLQKHLMLMNINEAYTFFKDK